MKPNSRIRIIIISVALSLAIVGASVFFTFVSLRTIDEPEVETVITISPTSPAEDYAAYVASKKRKIEPFTNRLREFHRHSTDANKHNHPHANRTGKSTDDELKKKFEVMRADYEAFLNSAHPDVAAAMRARLPFSALTVENHKKMVRDRQRQKR